MEWIAWVSILLGAGSAVVIAVDEILHPQRMSVMNFVWPLTALYLPAITVWWYWRVGRRMAKDSPAMTMEHGGHSPVAMDVAPTLAESALATSHCGAGCALGDLVTEYVVFAMGLTLPGRCCGQVLCGIL